MDRKFLAILLIFLVGASFLTLGCADRRNPPLAPTITPTASPSPSTQASTAPAGAPSATAAAPTVTPGPGGPPNSPGLDPSLADISGEGNDEEGFPETGLPTPTLD
ncbi:MAG TPA: hypothetical protein VMC61_03305 [Methanocella sp.]|nr:hypothetical protein [Methanocella sp.]